MTSLRTSNNGTVDITISQLKFAHNNIKEAPRTSLSIISWGALGTSIQSNMPSPNDITRAFDKNITGVFSSNNITIKGLIITLNEDIYSQLHHINTEDILYGCYRDLIGNISQWHHRLDSETSLNGIIKTHGISHRHQRNTDDILHWHHRLWRHRSMTSQRHWEYLTDKTTDTLGTSYNDITEHWVDLSMTS